MVSAEYYPVFPLSKSIGINCPVCGRDKWLKATEVGLQIQAVCICESSKTYPKYCAVGTMEVGNRNNVTWVLDKFPVNELKINKAIEKLEILGYTVEEDLIFRDVILELLRNHEDFMDVMNEVIDKIHEILGRSCKVFLTYTSEYDYDEDELVIAIDEGTNYEKMFDGLMGVIDWISERFPYDSKNVPIIVLPRFHDVGEIEGKERAGS